MSSVSNYEKLHLSRNNFSRAKSGSRPIRLLQRFIPDKIANTGEDPKGKYFEFIKHDIIKPLSSKTIQQRNDKIVENCNKNRWALNTAKTCSSPNKLPKLQPFKEYNFYEINPLDAQNNKNSYFKTDHISVKVPTSDNSIKGVTFLEKKTKYCHNTTTYSNGWIPRGDYKTISNRSSVTYNILNNDNNYSMAALDSKIMDIKLFNRKKCIAEFDDLNHVFHPNYSSKYNSTISENPKVFKTYKGVFTNMYDAANRNGNIIEVFKKTLLKKEEKKDNKNGGLHHSNSNNFSQSVITNKGNKTHKGIGANRNKNNSDNISIVMSHEGNHGLKSKNSPKKKQ